MISSLIYWLFKCIFKNISFPSFPSVIDFSLHSTVFRKHTSCDFNQFKFPGIYFMTSPRVSPGQYCMCCLEDHVFYVVGAVLCVAGRPMGLFFRSYLSYLFGCSKMNMYCLVAASGVSSLHCGSGAFSLGKQTLNCGTWDPIP